MRERNLYLEKCRQIENLGDELAWKDNENGLMKEVHSILYQNKP